VADRYFDMGVGVDEAGDDGTAAGVERPGGSGLGLHLGRRPDVGDSSLANENCLGRGVRGIDCNDARVHDREIAPARRPIRWPRLASGLGRCPRSAGRLGQGDAESARGLKESSSMHNLSIFLVDRSHDIPSSDDPDRVPKKAV
jgi:hypothetical protein